MVNCQIRDTLHVASYEIQEATREAEDKGGFKRRFSRFHL